MSLSLNEAITKFAQTDREYREKADERRELSSILTEYAKEADATQKTVHLQNEKGFKVDVEMKSKVEYDPTLMQDVAQLLNGKFDELFDTVITFKPRARPLKMFLNTKSTSEAEETAKKIIQEARIETEQSAYVHMSKG